MPTQTQIGSISKRGAQLDSALAMTPNDGRQYVEKAAMAIGKMLLTLPSREGGEAAVETKLEAYMAAVDDLPFWAIQDGIRRWYRGDCDKKYDCRWQPAPAVLRELAFAEFYRVKSIRRDLAKLLQAEPLIEFDEDHRTAMEAKIRASGVLRPMGLMRGSHDS